MGTGFAIASASQFPLVPRVPRLPPGTVFFHRAQGFSFIRQWSRATFAKNAGYRFSRGLPYRPVGLMRRISSMMAKGAIWASGA